MDLIGLPLTSIILFVLAGILIGHSFWYRDRSGDVEKINWLEKRYLQARNVSRQRKLELRELHKSRDQQQFELGSLRQRYEANLVQFKSLERSAQSAAQELNEMRLEQRETGQQLVDEQRRSERLVSQLQEVLQSKANLESELKRREQTVSQLSESLEQTKPLETKVQTLQSELTQSKDVLQQVGEDLHARSADLDAIRTQRDSLQQELAVTHEHAAKVKETASQQEIKLINVREQLEELLPLRAESAEACLTIAEQRLELAAQQEEFERHRDQAMDQAERSTKRHAA